MKVVPKEVTSPRSLEVARLPGAGRELQGSFPFLWFRKGGDSREKMVIHNTPTTVCPGMGKWRCPQTLGRDTRRGDVAVVGDLLKNHDANGLHRAETRAGPEVVETEVCPQAVAMLTCGS